MFFAEGCGRRLRAAGNKYDSKPPNDILGLKE